MQEDPEIRANVDEEKQLVEEIERQAGWFWEPRKIMAIPSDRPEVAEKVFPILAARLANGVRPSTRWNIYSRMGTRYGAGYLGLLLDQLPKEPERSEEMRILMPALVNAADDADIPRVWLALRDRRSDPGPWWRAVSVLANRKTAPPEVAILVRRILEEDKLPLFAYQFASSIGDRRIRDWFASQLGSDDKDLARLARKVAGKCAKKPVAAVLSSEPLVRYPALESTEMDLDDAPAFFRQLKLKYGLELPRWLQSTRGLEFLEIDQWASVIVGSKSGDSYTLSLRLEDYDVIEVLLTTTFRDRPLICTLGLNRGSAIWP